MRDTADRYWKLRPMPPTPEDELCSCPHRPPIVLQPHLSANPVSCSACNREVLPEHIGYSPGTAEKLADWQRFHDCFYFLWLDSREFESWAKAQLEDPVSPVNQRGLALVAELNQTRRAYYWWFEDTGSADWEPTLQCPRCKGDLIEQQTRRVCETCSIVFGKGGAV